MAQTVPFRLNHTAQALLVALNRFAFLSSGQLISLFYSPTATSKGRELLKKLRDEGFLTCHYLHLVPSGRPVAVYALSQKGRSFLRAQGYELHRLRPPALSTLLHTLEANQVIVTAHRLSRFFSELSLAGFKTEEELKRSPVPVMLPDGTQSSVTSDAWLDLDLKIRDASSLSFPLLLELDRGTEPTAQWKTKVRRLVALSHGAYEQAFGTPYLTILVLTTAGELRFKNLLAWTEAELTESGEEAEAGLFRLGAVSTSELANPNLFITHPLFIPGSGEPTTLLADVPGHSFEAEATREEEGGDLPVYP